MGHFGLENEPDVFPFSRILESESCFCESLTHRNFREKKSLRWGQCPEDAQCFFVFIQILFFGNSHAHGDARCSKKAPEKFVVEISGTL